MLPCATQRQCAWRGQTQNVDVAINDTVWEQLFPLAQHRIVLLLVERIIVSPKEMQVRLQLNGIENLALDGVRVAGRKAVAA